METEKIVFKNKTLFVIDTLCVYYRYACKCVQVYKNIQKEYMQKKKKKYIHTSHF